MLRLLTFSTLFPNPGQPVHGVFVENRLRHLLASGEVAARVVAPVPWFPLASPRFGRYAAYARVPPVERRDGLDIHHPRFPVLPRIGMTAAPALMWAAMRGPVRRLLAAGDFDLIDAHYFYPDGVAAALLGRELGKPVVITGRGTDLSLIPDHPLARRQILWAAGRAAGLVTVCRALAERLVELGVPRQRIDVLRNGVDLALFSPGERGEARAALGFERPTLLSVGQLIPRKGHDLVIAALVHLPGVDLAIAGEGPERPALEALAGLLGVAERVRFLGQLPHRDLPRAYRAADLLVLASSREGWANVLLEAMACGTPVAATDVWGTSEVVTSAAAGLLIGERDPAAVAAAVRRLLDQPPRREDTRAHAERFGWQATTDGQLALFGRVVRRGVRLAA